MKKYYLIVFMLCSALVAFAQGGKPKISGIVQDDKNEAVPYAAVAVFNSSDSSLVSGSTTDAMGKFAIAAKPGNYYVRVSFLSYEPKFISNINLKRGGSDLGTIVLSSGTLALDEVQITAEKSQMKLNLDKRVLTVGKDLANAGSNAAQIMDNIPSVNVDVEGNVSLRGSENVRILVNGKPSGLVGISSTDALRQMQGNMIESIEVITNPSARYDAEGEVGIINIILKKDRRKGVNGSFQLTGGYPLDLGSSFMLNYRKNKINMFTSYGLNYDKTPGAGVTYQEFRQQDTTYITERTREHLRGGLSHNVRMGADYFINEFNILTLSGIYKKGQDENVTDLVFMDSNPYNDLVYETRRGDTEIEDEENGEITLNYRKTFPQKGREWVTDIKYLMNDETETSVIRQEANERQEDFNFRSSNTEDEVNFFFQSDYVHPFAKEGKFEAGVRATLRTINNKFSVEQELDNGEWIPYQDSTDIDYDNHFVYNENIYAAYLMAGNKTGKFSYQGGLRAEYSDISTELKRTNEVNPREYLNLFPSAHFSYELDSANTVQLSYSRRLSRPRFRHLLPFYSFSDNRNRYQGNPNLNPEFTNSFELGYLKYLPKGSILSSIYYRHRTGVIDRVTLIKDSVTTLRIPVNLSVQNAYGIEFNVNYDFTDWWSANASMNFYRAITEGEYSYQAVREDANGQMKTVTEQLDLYSDTYTWSGRASTKVKVEGIADFQANVRYRAPRITPQGRSLALYVVDLGASREILKGNGTLTLSVRDLFNSRRWRSITETPTYYSENEFQWRARQLLLTFNYRLNQKKQRGKGKRGGYDGGGDMDF